MPDEYEVLVFGLFLKLLKLKTIYLIVILLFSCGIEDLETELSLLAELEEGKSFDGNLKNALHQGVTMNNDQVNTIEGKGTTNTINQGLLVKAKNVSSVGYDGDGINYPTIFDDMANPNTQEADSKIIDAKIEVGYDSGDEEVGYDSGDEDVVKIKAFPKSENVLDAKKLKYLLTRNRTNSFFDSEPGFFESFNFYDLNCHDNECSFKQKSSFFAEAQEHIISEDEISYKADQFSDLFNSIVFWEEALYLQKSSEHEKVVFHQINEGINYRFVCIDKPLIGYFRNLKVASQEGIRNEIDLKKMHLNDEYFVESVVVDDNFDPVLDENVFCIDFKNPRNHVMSSRVSVEAVNVDSTGFVLIFYFRDVDRTRLYSTMRVDGLHLYEKG